MRGWDGTVHRVALTIGCVGAIAAAGFSGCVSRSASIVGGESVVSVPRNANLIIDRSFTGVHWLFELPPGGTTTRLRGPGGPTLKISSGAHPGPLAVEMATSYLPTVAAGAKYVFRIRVRTVDVSPNVTPAVRLNYLGGGYAVFTGPPLVRLGNTPGWTTAQVVATAQLPLTSIAVVALQSGGLPFSGTVWIADPELRLLKG